MSVPWFHVQTVPESGSACQLDRGELRHLRSARRITSGQTVVVFDGAGVVAEACVESSAGDVTLCVLDRRVQPRPPCEIHLISALPKGDRSATMLGMATQLGMSSFRALDSDRAVVSQSAGAVDRWRRVMVEACKQSHRAWLPDVLSPIDVAGVAELTRLRSGATHVAHPGGEAGPGSWDHNPPDGLRLVIGPEGGLSGPEIELLVTSGASLIDLGPGILRIETAAVAMLTLASAWQRAHPGPERGSAPDEAVVGDD